MTTFRSSGKTQQIFHWSREQFQTIFSITFVVALPETSTFLHQTRKPKGGPRFMEPRKCCLIALASAFRFFVVGFIVKQYKLYIIFFQRFYLYICSIPISNHTLQWNKRKNQQNNSEWSIHETPAAVEKKVQQTTHTGRPRYQIYPSTNSIRSDSVRQTVEYIGTDKADICLSDCRFSLMYFNCFGLNFH